MTRDAPIGVFDSGVGGLTVVHALRTQLPAESLIYVGDTARVPYGPKSPETVQRYAGQIADWLVDQQVKAIVVACNTATAHALPMLQARYDIPVIGVITPGARAAVRATVSKAVGVIGTAGTIASGAYESAIHLEASDIGVHSVACSLFVPLVEEGWIEHEVTQLVAREYLTPFRHTPIDVLVLGCTHYPLIASIIQQAMPTHVRLVDSAEETAAETGRVLAERNLQRTESRPGQLRFIASDAPDRFLSLGRRFLGDAITAVEHVTFG